MSELRTLEDLLQTSVQDRVVLVRSDLNVPFAEDGTITDYGRIDASLPTIRALIDAGAKIVIASHLGRPGGKPDGKYSLRPVAAALSERLGKQVQFATDTVGQDALSRVEGLLVGDVLLLENVRFDPRETSKDDAQRQQFAEALVDIVGADAAFVSDGFGVVHRKQASVYDIGLLLPAYAGYLVEKELDVLSVLTTDPLRPYAVILGGSKVSDKIGVIEALAPKVDTLIIVGGMVFTFFAALGIPIGDSLVEKDHIDSAKKLLDQYADIIKLPVDIVAAEKFSAASPYEIVDSNSIPNGWMGLDIGPLTVEQCDQYLQQAKTIFWNGPAGVFEFPAFASGTSGLAQAIISTTQENDAFSVVGGGDSAAAVRTLGLPEDGFSHISTGGGASLEFIEGAAMPGLAVLTKNEE